MRRVAYPWLWGGVIGGLLAVGANTALAAATTVEQHGATASYNLTLDVGPMEQMLTAAQAQMQHATSGEIMAAMPGMSMPMTMAMGNHHVEVHVTNKGTGAVVKDATVAISLTDVSDKAVGTIAVQPVMAMYGVAAGQNDWHYGNNAQLPDGSYAATVTVNGQQAAFTNLVLASGASASTMPTPMTTGTLPGMPTPMPAGMAGGSPAQMPAGAASGTGMGMPASGTGATQMAAATVPAQMPATGAGGSQTAPVRLLASFLAAFGVVAGIRRLHRPARG